MIPFQFLLPDIAQREVRCIHLQPEPGVPLTSGLHGGEYAFVEFYCEDLNCDCRRAFIQVIARDKQDQVLASINCGWEAESFYRERMSYDPDAPRQVVQGSLDPINTQSEHSEELLELFQRQVLDDSYRLRLQRHNELFREELRRRHPSTARESPSTGEARTGSSDPRIGDSRIPAAHRQRFGEVAALLQQFGRKRLDDELTGFAIELWSRAFAEASFWKPSRTCASRMKWFSLGKRPSKWVMCPRMRGSKICSESTA